MAICGYLWQISIDDPCTSRTYPQVAMDTLGFAIMRQLETLGHRYQDWGMLSLETECSGNFVFVSDRTDKLGGSIVFPEVFLRVS